VKSLRPVTRLPLEVHLMIEAPDRFAEAFVKAGGDRVIVHCRVWETSPAGRLTRSGGWARRPAWWSNPEKLRWRPPMMYLPNVDLLFDH